MRFSLTILTVESIVQEKRCDEPPNRKANTGNGNATGEDTAKGKTLGANANLAPGAYPLHTTRKDTQ